MLQKEAKYLKMEVLTVFLLIGCTLTVEAFSKDDLLADYNEFFRNKKGTPIMLNGRALNLSNKTIGITDNSVVWKAHFDKTAVALKIYVDPHSNQKQWEAKAYQTLNASNDPNIETNGIPRMYYSGKIFDNYSGIVMTLFDDSVYRRWLRQHYTFNAYSTLQVFLQSVKALQYINRKGMLHNDIKPLNIFLRGSKVFVGDFDHSTNKNAHFCGWASDYFASSRGLQNKKGKKLPLGPRDDLQSLVYTIWFIEDIYRGSEDAAHSNIVISKQSYLQNVELIKKRCEHFANFPRSKDACLFISNQMLYDDNNNNRNDDPDYGRMILILQEAIDEVKAKTKQTDFEWLAPRFKSSKLKFGVAPKRDSKGFLSRAKQLMRVNK